MTKEEASKRIEIMQAYVNGEEIQFWDTSKNAWLNIPDPFFGYMTKYRIKPKNPKYKVAEIYSKFSDKRFLTIFMDYEWQSMEKTESFTKWITPELEWVQE